MPVEWPFADDCLNLRGIEASKDADADHTSHHVRQINALDAERQTATAKAILAELHEQPGIVLADEVGMGKTYVALAVAASVLIATKGKQGPVVVMVPSGLRGKWQQEWFNFKTQCATDSRLDSVKVTHARSPADFFKLLDDEPKDADGKRRPQLVFMTTGCFTQQRTRDAWIKLAMIRMARRHTKLNAIQEKRLCRWASNLVGLSKATAETDPIVAELLKSNLTDWHGILKKSRRLKDASDDPVPNKLKEYEAQPDACRPIIKVIRHALPRRSSGKEERDHERMKQPRKEFNSACEIVFKQWLHDSSWESPLLILDEAHHAKNDKTELAELFRESSRSDTQLLAGKFQRMLFLTATPFQLGHQELVRVLRSFGAIRWEGRSKLDRTDAKDRFCATIDTLETALNENRQAGRTLDKLWGKIERKRLGDLSEEDWWRRVAEQPQDDLERQLNDAVKEGKRTRDAAQVLLRPWVVRHNRQTKFPGSTPSEEKPRRVALAGRAILNDDATPEPEVEGLSVDDATALPFMLAARVQGELTRRNGSRLFFAGLASSYEAFNHTSEDESVGVSPNKDSAFEPRIPIEWYEKQIANLIPSKDKSLNERFQHPKIRATVERAVKLWSRGEKVLVFCQYQETCKALFRQIDDKVQTAILRMAVEKLGSDYDENKAGKFLDQAHSRLNNKRNPLYGEVHSLLRKQFQLPRYARLNAEHQQTLTQVLAAYFRTPAFIVRNLPLGDAKFQAAFAAEKDQHFESQAAIEALRSGICEHKDESDQTCLERIHHFLDFAVELAVRSQCQAKSNDDDPNDDRLSPLNFYLSAVSYFTDARSHDDDSGKVDEESVEPHATRQYRAAKLKIVRHVHGNSNVDREQLAFAFNSPLLPEILVSTRVMGEGIDLHRFCRHVIHHDGCWNPSTLEQQTGRLDRIRCQADACLKPIVIYQPFIAGSADEKMYRVLRDRERWFQIVMGQKFEFDEATSEAYAARVPLPESLAKQLTFDLSRWSQTSINEQPVLPGSE